MKIFTNSLVVFLYQSASLSYAVVTNVTSHRFTTTNVYFLCILHPGLAAALSTSSSFQDPAGSFLGPSDPIGGVGNLWQKHAVVLKAPARKCLNITQAHRSLAKVSHVARPDVNGTESIILLQERELCEAKAYHARQLPPGSQAVLTLWILCLGTQAHAVRSLGHVEKPRVGICSGGQSQPLSHPCPGSSREVSR